MQLTLLSAALLGTGALALRDLPFGVRDDDHASSNVTYFGAPHLTLDGTLPIIEVGESYIRGQLSGDHGADSLSDAAQCGPDKECQDKSCCNSDGICGYRPEHCRPDKPKTCLSNCDAKAPCGEFSIDGRTTCPLNLCCSYFGWCGTTETFCRDQNESGEPTPCQKKFGKCEVQSPPSCGKNSGTASKGRRVAYYQVWNTRNRKCDKIWPSQLDTRNMTHMILAFASVDPKTYKITPEHPDDPDIYRQFTSLKRDNMQTWIGIGGWEFTDPGPTFHTFSEMASSKENRKKFIDSLVEFMDKYEFQGADIDWEYPGDPVRGGNDKDKRNQIDLLVEIRKAFGDKYGLSLALPAPYNYLKHMDPKALEAQVDFFNFLSYDLHGIWDSWVEQYGPKLRPHTDLKEIDDALIPLWFNEIDPKKINLGLANYGRGYTVVDQNCMHYGCDFKGPANRGDCTNLEGGVLSLCEIKRIIKSKNLTPGMIIGGASVKQVMWDDQWVGYDDEETLAMKVDFANDRCLGGTALWAIDYAICGENSGANPPESMTPVSTVSVSPSQASSDMSVSIPADVSTGTELPHFSLPTTDAPPGTTILPPQWTGSSGFSTSVVISSPEEPSSGENISTAPSNAPVTSPAELSTAPASDPSSSGLASSVGPAPSSASSSFEGTHLPSPSQIVSSSSSWNDQSSSSVANSSNDPGSSSSGTGMPAPESSAAEPWIPSESEVMPSSAPPQSETPSALPSQSESFGSSTANPSSVATTSGQDVTGTWSNDASTSQAVPTSTENMSLPSLPSEATSSAGSGPPSPGATSTRDWIPPNASLTSSESAGVSPPPLESSSESVWVPTSAPQSSSDGVWIPTYSGTSSGSVWITPFPSQATSSESLWLPSVSSGASSDGAIWIPNAPSPGVTAWPGCFLLPHQVVTTSDPWWFPQATSISDYWWWCPPPGVTPASSQGGDFSTTSSEGEVLPTTPSQGEVSPTTSSQGEVLPSTSSQGGEHSTTSSQGGDHPKTSSQDESHPTTGSRSKDDEKPKPTTTGKGDDNNNDNNGNDPGKKCDHPQLFGCGCGFMGLPFGPGCDDGGSHISVDLPSLGFKCSIFGCDGGCSLFGCIGINGGCGTIGCDGYCLIPGGCPKCPDEICKLPDCETIGGCGPKPGPHPKAPKPKPPKSPKPTPPPTGNPTGPTPPPPTGGPTGTSIECEEKDKTTATQVLVSCSEYPTKAPSCTSYSSGTVSCETPPPPSSLCTSLYTTTYTACGWIRDSESTTNVPYTNSTYSSSRSSCTGTPLDLDDDEDPVFTPSFSFTNSSTTAPITSFSFTNSSFSGPTSTSSSAACTNAPLNLDDDEGDNEGLPPGSSSPVSNSSTTAPWTSSSSNFNTSVAATTTSSFNSTSESSGISTQTYNTTSETSSWISTSTISSSTSRSIASTSSASSTENSSSSSTSIFSTTTSTPPAESSSSPTPTEVTPTWSPKPTKTPDPIRWDSQWLILIEHYIENGEGSVLWILYDQNGNQAGMGESSPITSQNRPPQDSLPFKVDFDVDEIKSKEKSRYRFTIEVDIPDKKKKCRPFWMTEELKDLGPGGTFRVDACMGLDGNTLTNDDLWCDPLRYNENTEWREPNFGGEMRRFFCGFKGFRIGQDQTCDGLTPVCLAPSE